MSHSTCSNHVSKPLFKSNFTNPCMNVTHFPFLSVNIFLSQCSLHAGTSMWRECLSLNKITIFVTTHKTSPHFPSPPHNILTPWTWYCCNASFAFWCAELWEVKRILQIQLPLCLHSRECIINIQNKYHSRENQ